MTEEVPRAPCGACLYQQHVHAARGQPCGQRAAARARADDDVVVAGFRGPTRGDRCQAENGAPPWVASLLLPVGAPRLLAGVARGLLTGRARGLLTGFA